MTNLRTQAAAAAKEWELSESEVSGDCPRDDDGVLQASGVFVAGYLLGHAAGVEEGARSALGWAFDNSFLDLHDWEKEGEEITFDELLARFLSSLAPGTVLATGEGQKEEGA